MSQPEETNRTMAGLGSQLPAKKRYQKPAMRYERIFETRALSCGKVVTTQAQCAHNTRTS